MSTFQGYKSPFKYLGLEDGISHMEAKYPAILFKQQLTACVEKIFGLIRDNLKKEMSPLLGSCIQVGLSFLLSLKTTNKLRTPLPPSLQAQKILFILYVFVMFFKIFISSMNYLSSLFLTLSKMLREVLVVIS